MHEELMKEWAGVAEESPMIIPGDNSLRSKFLARNHNYVHCPTDGIKGFKEFLMGKEAMRKEDIEERMAELVASNLKLKENKRKREE